MKLYNKHNKHIDELVIIKCDKCNKTYELEDSDMVDIDDMISINFICDCGNDITITSRMKLFFDTIFHNLENEFTEAINKLNPHKKNIDRIIFAQNKLINIITK